MTTAKTSRLQYFLMIPNLIFGKAIGITAGVMVRKVGADTWLSMTIGFAIGIAVILITTFLCSRFPEKTIIQFAEELVGKWVGKGIGVVLALFFVMLYGASANVMTLHLNEYFLPETPFFLICLIYTVLCAYGVFLGPEVVIRFSLVGFIMLCLITLTMITGTINDFKTINLLPLMDEGLIKDVSSSFYVFGDIAMAVMAVGFFYPMLNKKRKVYGLTFVSMLIAAVMVIVWPLFETAVMGTDMMKQYVVVCMQQIRCAQLTKYFPRYELLMVSFFTFSVFIQSAAMFHCAKHCVKQVTGIKKDFIIMVPLSIILIAATYYMAKDHNKYVEFLTSPYSLICVVISIGLPLGLLIVAFFKGKLKKQEKTF